MFCLVCRVVSGCGTVEGSFLDTCRGVWACISRATCAKIYQQPTCPIKRTVVFGEARLKVGRNRVRLGREGVRFCHNIDFGRLQTGSGRSQKRLLKTMTLGLNDC